MDKDSDGFLSDKELISFVKNTFGGDIEKAKYITRAVWIFFKFLKYEDDEIWW